MTLDADLTRTPAGVSVPRCPVCSSELRLGREVSFDRWSCTLWMLDKLGRGITSY